MPLLRRPKGTGRKVDLLEVRRSRLANLALVEYDGDWWKITANADGVKVQKWHQASPCKVFPFEMLIRNTTGKLLQTKTPAATVGR